MRQVTAAEALEGAVDGKQSPEVDADVEGIEDQLEVVGRLGSFRAMNSRTSLSSASHL